MWIVPIASVSSAAMLLLEVFLLLWRAESVAMFFLKAGDRAEPLMFPRKSVGSSNPRLHFHTLVIFHNSMASGCSLTSLPACSRASVADAARVTWIMPIMAFVM